MKSIILTLAIILSSFIARAQTFEGEVVYHNIYKSKLANVSDMQFADMMGNTQNYFVKAGNYKSEVNGKLMQWQLYNTEDGKLYTKMSNSEAVLYNDVSVNNDEVITSEMHKNATTIMGYLCDELILTCKSGVQKYYFSSKLPLVGKLYANHKFGNWNIIMEKVNALPLKIEIETAQFSLTSMATNINPMKLNDTFFRLPANMQTVKSPY